MIIKKPAICISSYNGLVYHPNFHSPPSAQTSSLSKRYSRRRGYETVKKDEPFIDQWPQPLHPNKLPSPYQILDHKRGTTYSKARFVELVKLYHPDRTDHPAHASLCKSLPAPVRLERYRLIIAAHAILSDPYKTTAYDLHGAGWAGQPDVIRARYPGYGPDSPMSNATWEDWEAWYQRQRTKAGEKPQRQKPAFMSNGAFISLIGVLAALGGIGQAARADITTKSVLQLREEADEEAKREMKRVREEARGFTKGERIENFLRSKDPVADSHEGLRSVMLEMDVCGMGQGRGGSVRNKNADFRRQYHDTGQKSHPLQHKVDAVSPS